MSIGFMCLGAILGVVALLASGAYLWQTSSPGERALLVMVALPVSLGIGALIAALL